MFGTDGVRSRANEEPMTVETMVMLAEAVSWTLGEGEHKRHRRVVIGKDTRRSGYIFEPALAAGFVAAGFDALLLGPLPTPGVAILTRSLRADLGVMISASHNPHEDNGVKLFDAGGFKLGRTWERRIEERIALRRSSREVAPLRAPPDQIGGARRIEDATARYIEIVKASLPRGASFAGMKIVLDCAHGAAYRAAPAVLAELDVEVIPIGVTPNGFNINLDAGVMGHGDLRRLVVEHRADLGIALDGDGDRVLIVDETGAELNGDILLALFAEHWRQLGLLRGDAVVGTLMSNLGLEQYLDGIGLRLIRTKVGDRHVVEEMRRLDCNLGGEQSGHLVFSDFAATGDGLLAALQTLHILQASKRRASEVRRLFRPYPQILTNVPLSGDSCADTAILERSEIMAAIRSGENALSGCGRLLVRESGTEPVIRIMAEGEDPLLIRNIVKEIVTALQR